MRKSHYHKEELFGVAKDGGSEKDIQEKDSAEPKRRRRRKDRKSLKRKDVVRRSETETEKNTFPGILRLSGKKATCC